MEYDQRAASEKINWMREIAHTSNVNVAPLSNEDVSKIIEAFSDVTPPKKPKEIFQHISISSLNTAPSAYSRKPGNILLNWRKLMIIIPDITLAGYGVSNLGSNYIPIALAGLYIWGKIWCGSKEELSDSEATIIIALWKNRDNKNEILESEGFIKTNELRSNLSLSPLTSGQFTSAINRLMKIDCIELSQGMIWLREYVSIEY
jgi:hypothetical protein